MNSAKTLHSLTLVASYISWTAVALLATSVTAGIPAPRYDHVLIVVMENHSFDQVVASVKAPYLQSLIDKGALFTNSYGVAHPSQPNYFALFCGSTQGVKDDYHHDFVAPNLASELEAVGKTFVGYIEAGSPRDHNPWESFAGAKRFEQPLTAFPNDLRSLSAVNFVIPNLSNDMHDGPIERADAWLQQHLGPYATWAKSNNSLLIVTFDEDDGNANNHILTLFYGAHINPGQYAARIDHYTVLRTIEDIEGIAPLGVSDERVAITEAWTP